jgi:hypothetical protein
MLSVLRIPSEENRVPVMAAKGQIVYENRRADRLANRAGCRKGFARCKRTNRARRPNLRLLYSGGRQRMRARRRDAGLAWTDASSQRSATATSVLSA